MLNGTTDRFVSQSDRIFISNDGTLYFSYNVPEDATSYACSIALSTTRSGNYGPFFNLRLSYNPAELVVFAPRIDDNQPQIFPERPHIASTAYIECFAYAKPSPTYHWERTDGRNLSATSKLLNFGRILKIDELGSQDEGTYRCTVRNDIGEDNRETTLILQAIPEFIWPLTDQLVSINSTATFECRLTSTDISIEWFRNSVPISPLLLNADDRMRIKVDNNMLTISPTKVEDSGVYQCIASTEFGSISSSAFLIVKDFKPKFDGNIMSRRVFAVEKSNLIIPCIFHSSPIGRVMWFRQDAEPISTRGRVRHNASRANLLQIDIIHASDEGNYTCAAANYKGQAEFQVEVIVIKKTDVIVNPRHKFLHSKGDNFSISCEVETSCKYEEKCPEPLFDWFLNDQPMRVLPFYKKFRSFLYEEYAKHENHEKKLAQKVKQKTKLELLTNLESSKIGRFSCVSLYGGGTTEIEVPPVPLSPVNLKVINVSTNSIKLSWKQPLNQHNFGKRHMKETVDGYQVEIRAKDDLQWKSAPGGLLVTNGGLVAAYKLDHLLPNKEYQFRVKARDGSRFSYPSKSTEWTKTLLSAPMEKIRNIRWRKIDNENILVLWDPIKNNKNYENLHYLVSWSDKTHHYHLLNIASTEEMYTTISEDAQMHTVSMEDPGHIIRINKNDTCHVISVSIRGANSIGVGPANSDLIIYSSRNTPTRKAVSIQVHTLNSSCAIVHWKWANKSKCENAYGAKISCTPSNASNSAFITQSFLSNHIKWTFCGMEAQTQYSCRIIPFDQYGRQNNDIDEFCIVTKWSPPEIAPEIKSWHLLRKAENLMVHLEWTFVNLNEDILNGSKECGYKIFLYISETANKPIVLKVPESDLRDRDLPSVLIAGLKLMYDYKIKICGYNEGGDGPTSQLHSLRLGTDSFIEISASTICSFASNYIIFILYYLMIHC